MDSQTSMALEYETNNVITSNESSLTKLFDTWNMYAHLPHDTDWSLSSYKNIMSISNLEEGAALISTIPDIMIKNCMLFIMRQGITPIWEDPKNRSGGCFSYKVPNGDVPVAWRNLCYHILGESITNDSSLMSKINGATISPKRNFCIIKIWLSDCEIQSVSKIVNVNGLDKRGVIFKRHKPEY